MFTIGYLGYTACAERCQSQEEHRSKTDIKTRSAQKGFRTLVACGIDVVTLLALVIIGSCILRSSPSAGWGVLGSGLGNAGLLIGLFVSLIIANACTDKKAEAEYRAPND